MDQEQADSWMSRPENEAPCPPGLAFLTTLGQLQVEQLREPSEIWTGYKTWNKYVVKNKLGEKVYWAEENSNTCQRCCFGNNRTIDVVAIDRDSRASIQMYRPASCVWGWENRSMNVFSPPGHLIGSIYREFSFFYPSYIIRNAAGDTVLYIQGPLIKTGFFRNVDFSVTLTDRRTVVGRISKQFTGVNRELFTDADLFQVFFPGDLDVRIKAVLLSACFLIDFDYYQIDCRASCPVIRSIFN